MTFTPNNKERVKSQFQHQTEFKPFLISEGNLNMKIHPKEEKDLQVIRFYGNSNNTRKLEIKKGHKNASAYENVNKTPPKTPFVQFNKTNLSNLPHHRDISPNPKNPNSHSPANYRKLLEKAKISPLVDHSPANVQWKNPKITYSYEGITPR